MPTEPAGCLLGFLANLLGRRPKPTTAPPKVIVNKFFITDGERNFFQVLRQAAGPCRFHYFAGRCPR